MAFTKHTACEWVTLACKVAYWQSLVQIKNLPSWI